MALIFQMNFKKRYISREKRYDFEIIQELYI
jgi:hypothetical protein